MKHQNEPQTPRARANRRYYLANREHIIARSKERYRRRVTEVQQPSLSEPKTTKVESLESPKIQPKREGLFNKWIQRLTGKRDGQSKSEARD